MPRYDIYHEVVKRCLINDGWVITHDPFVVKVGRKNLSIDLGSEKLIGANKGLVKIAVEIKSFVGRSDVRDLEQALGQYVLYQSVLAEQNIDRRLYLAISQEAYRDVFEIELGAIFIRRGVINLIVFDETQESIVAWIPN